MSKDDKVIELVSKEEKSRKEYREDLVEILDQFRQRIIDNEVDEFVISSTDMDGENIITICTKDYIGAVGLFEIGKHNLMMQQSFSFE